jgi:hypothetical protein
MKEKKIKKQILNATKILLLASCCYSTYVLAEYWIALMKKDFHELFLTPGVGVLLAVSVLVIALWLMYFYVAKTIEENY